MKYLILGKLFKPIKCGDEKEFVVDVDVKNVL
jgi:hypothetical protein